MSNIVLRDYQEGGVNDIRGAFRSNDVVVFVLPTGGGKCLGRGTPVLLFDGSIKPVEDVEVGDMLMGPDSRPRRVLSLASGREQLYRVTPVKGDPYVVNESHILSLKRTGSKATSLYPSQGGGAVVNISVREYLAKSATFKHTHKGWRAAVDFPSGGHLRIEPYFLGLWLGDGHSNIAAVTTGDEEIARYLIDYADRLGMQIGWADNSPGSILMFLRGKAPTGRGGTPIMNRLRAYGVLHNKHVPHDFKIASRRERLELLAGLLDTDGHYTGKGYDLCLKNERLLDDAIFVARSLGFAAYKVAKGSYWRCTISGDVDAIPCRLPRKFAARRRQKKDPLVTGITVDPIGEGEYFGFEIDGDHLFMLGDFTVTHNTYTFCYIADSAALKGRHVLIVVHRKELLKQASKSLSKMGIEHGLIAPWATPKPKALIQVASVDALDSKKGRRLLETALVRGDLLIFDEGHHVTLESKWGRVWQALTEQAERRKVKMKTLLVTASPGRPDGKGLGKGHGGIADTIVVGPSVPELIERGCLLKPRVFGCVEAPDIEGIKLNSQGDLDAKELAHRVDKPRLIGNAVKEYSEVCPGARAVAFCVNVQHAIHVRDEFNAAGYRFALLVGDKELVSEGERTRIVEQLDSGELDGICTVDLVSEGFDCPGLVCCIMMRPTESEIVFLQQVGRVMRIDEGKTECFLIDQAGNVGRWKGAEFKAKHGMPHIERDWSQALEGRKKRSRAKKDDEPAVIEMIQCKHCRYIFDAGPEKCPSCDEPVPVKSAGGRSAPDQVDGRLVEITPEMEREAARKARAAQGRASSVEDMIEQLGYSRARAEKIIDARIEKQALIDGLVEDMRDWFDQTGQTAPDTFGVSTFDIKRMKPRELRDLRKRVDDHMAVWRAVRQPAQQQAAIDF